MKIGGKYRIYETLGKGAFGTTHKVTNFRDPFTLKEMKLTDLLDVDGANKELDSYENVPRHENVTTVISHFTENSLLYVVFEFTEYGNLNDYAIAKKLDDVGKLRAIKDIVNGLQHLHKHGVVHGNIKPTNLLLTITHGDKPVFKISDFNTPRYACSKDSLSTSLTPNKSVSDYTAGSCGLVVFWSPEVKDGRYLPSGDIFSVGVVLFALHQMRTEAGVLCPLIKGDGAESPVALCRQDDIAQAVQATVPAGLKDIVQGMLSLDPDSRPSLETVADSL